MSKAELALWVASSGLVGFLIGVFMCAKLAGACDRDAAEMRLWTHKKKAYRLVPMDPTGP